MAHFLLDKFETNKNKPINFFIELMRIKSPKAKLYHTSLFLFNMLATFWLNLTLM
jgi:hypothetical protein